jgi:hypothetical protein
VHFTNSPHHLRAEPGPPGDDVTDFYFVRNGCICFTDDAGTIELTAGDMALMSASSAFDARSDRFEMLALGLPDEVLRIRGPRVSRKITGESGFATCLGALLEAVLARHADLTAEEGAILQTSILDAILYLGAHGRPDDNHKLHEVKALTLQWLPAPGLNPSHLAREVGISLRTLHRLSHPVLSDPTTPGGVIRYLPAHPHEGAVGAPAGDSSARVIATGRSGVTGVSFNIAVAFEPSAAAGPAIAESTFHHFADYNWDPGMGAPSFVDEPPGDGLARFPPARLATERYVRNVALWLAGQA